MPTRILPRRVARRPLTDRDCEDRAMCACPLLPRGHQKLHCRQLREQSGGVSR